MKIIIEINNGMCLVKATNEQKLSTLNIDANIIVLEDESELYKCLLSSIKSLILREQDKFSQYTISENKGASK